jgi:hypothetical protein
LQFTDFDSGPFAIGRRLTEEKWDSSRRAVGTDCVCWKPAPGSSATREISRPTVSYPDPATACAHVLNNYMGFGAGITLTQFDNFRANLTNAVQAIRIKASTRGDHDTEADATRAEVLLMKLWVEIEAHASERGLGQYPNSTPVG